MTAMRSRRALIRPRCDDDVSSLNEAVLGPDLKACGTQLLPQRRHGYPATHGRADRCGIALDKAYDGLAWRKAVGIRAGVRMSGQLHHPVRELEAERVPAFTAPAL